MSQYTVRPARPADFDVVMALFDAFAEGESARDARHAFADDARTRYANDLRDGLRSDSQAVFVAEQDGTVIGYQTVALWYGPPIYRVEREAFLGEVYVVPAARRQGVASALIAAAKAWAEAAGAVRLRTVLLHANAASVALWQRLGATPLAHVYTLPLAAPGTAEAPARVLGFEM